MRIFIERRRSSAQEALFGDMHHKHFSRRERVTRNRANLSATFSESGKSKAETHENRYFNGELIVEWLCGVVPDRRRLYPT